MAKKETVEEKQYREMVESMATNIARLSREVSALMSGRVKRKTLIVLLAHSCKLSQADIDSVLTAVENLEGDYLHK